MASATSQLFRFSPAKALTQRTPDVLGRQVLVLGNEPAVLTYLQNILTKDQLEVTLLSKEQGLIRLQKGFAPDLILLQSSGYHVEETLAALREARPSVPIIVLSCFHDPQSIVKAIKMGASDCIQLPFQVDGLRNSVKNLLALVDHGQTTQVHETPLFDNTSFVCASERMNEIRGQCATLARVDIPIIVLGESGTGKEIIAQYIHKMSPRAHRTFLKVNCAAMPADLLESELFGYDQGAFTGAVRSKPGKFELCNMGTILLDEIGEMPPQLQSKLLQVLQDGTFSRLGGRSSIKVDVRVIAATNIDMDVAIATRAFREDLFYRLNGFSILLPPLRERKDEIPILIQHFMRKLSGKYARQAITMSEQLLQACMNYHWPGNLRELENYIKRFLVLGDERHMLAELQNARGNRPSALTQSVWNLDSTGGLKKLAREAMGEAESEAIEKVLKRNNWNRTQSATELRISYKALLYKIRQYGLTPPMESEPRARTVAAR